VSRDRPIAGDTRFKMACYLNMFAPVTFSVLGYPCAPHGEEAIIRGTLVFNALLAFIILKSPSLNMQEIFVHLKSLFICPGCFIIAKWWCGPSMALWAVLCIPLVIFQINLRIWIGGKLTRLHLLSHSSAAGLGWYQQRAGESTLSVGRALSDTTPSPTTTTFEDWMVPAATTLIATAAGVTFLSFTGRPTFQLPPEEEVAEIERQSPRPRPPPADRPPADGPIGFDEVLPVGRSQEYGSEGVESAAPEQEGKENEVVDGYLCESFGTPGEVIDICDETTLGTCSKDGKSASASSWERRSASQVSLKFPSELEQGEQSWEDVNTDLVVQETWSTGSRFVGGSHHSDVAGAGNDGLYIA